MTNGWLRAGAWRRGAVQIEPGAAVYFSSQHQRASGVDKSDRRIAAYGQVDTTMQQLTRGGCGPVWRVFRENFHLAGEKADLGGLLGDGEALRLAVDDVGVVDVALAVAAIVVGDSVLGLGLFLLGLFDGGTAA